MIERQNSWVKAETSEKRVPRYLDLSERQASRLAEETETVREARLQDMWERKAILEASLTGEQILARKKYRDKLYFVFCYPQFCQIPNCL